MRNPATQTRNAGREDVITLRVLLTVLFALPLAPQRKKTVARDNNLELLRLCKKYDVPTILGSDAHISFQIADYERLYPLIEETAFPDELIMNYWPERFFEYIDK